MDLIKQQQSNVNVQLINSEAYRCVQCNGLFFDQTFIFRKFNKYTIAALTDSYMPIPILICRDCGMPVRESMPSGVPDIDAIFE